MSRTPSSDRSTKFDDLEQYSRSSNYMARSGDLNAGEQVVLNPKNPPAIEPADGLHRGEVAELVAVIIEDHSVHVREESGDGTTPGTLLFENELKTGLDMKNRNINEGDGTADGKPDVRGNDYPQSNELLARWFAHNSASFNDTAAGTGGATGGGAGPWKVYNFREMFGQGPVMDHEEVIYERASFTINDMANQDVRATNYFRLFFDIAEKGDFGVYQS